MTITPLIQDTDSDYPMRALSALHMAHADLFGKFSPWKDSPIISCNLLFILMENIKLGTSLPPSQATFGLVRDHSTYHYRRPIWEAVDGVIKNHSKAVKMQTLQERAAWFQNILRLCVVYDEVQLLMKNLIAGAKALGLGVDIGGCAQPISIILNSEKTGKDARMIARELVPQMLEAVDALVSKSKIST